MPSVLELRIVVASIDEVWTPVLSVAENEALIEGLISWPDRLIDKDGPIISLDIDADGDTIDAEGR